MSLVPFVHVDATLAGAAGGDEIALTADEAHHLTTVLRLSAGASVEVADGVGGHAEAVLAGRALRLRDAPRREQRREPRIVVAQALPKGRKLDEVVRQVTELGVDGIVPVAAERSVTRLTGPKAERAVARWASVARAACEQARRTFRPTIWPILGLSELADMAGEPGTVLLVAHPGSPGLPHHLEAARAAERVVVAVGPEGGFSTAEVIQLETAGARLAGLGDATLRTEHAAAAATAVLVAGLGRWG